MEEKNIKMKLAEEEGQMSIFEMIDLGVNPEKVINKAEEDLSNVETDKFNNTLSIKEPSKLNLEYSSFSLDVFAGIPPDDFEDRLVGFNRKLDENNENFVIVVEKNSYNSIQDFKNDFDLDIVFPLKSESEPDKVVNLYEKKINQSRKTNKKSADNEAAKIRKLEESGIVSEDSEEQKDEEIGLKKRSKIKNKK